MKLIAPLLAAGAAGAASLCLVAGSADADSAPQPETAIDKPTCAGVYDALSKLRIRMIQTYPAFRQTNLAAIDYAGRSKALIGDDSDVKIAAVMASLKFQQAIVGDMIDKTHNEGVSDALTTSVRCDFANKFMPTFTPPATK